MAISAFGFISAVITVAACTSLSWEKRTFLRSWANMIYIWISLAQTQVVTNKKKSHIEIEKFLLATYSGQFKQKTVGKKKPLGAGQIRIFFFVSRFYDPTTDFSFPANPFKRHY